MHLFKWFLVSISYKFVLSTSHTGNLWETREVDTLKLSHQFESSVFVHQISILDFIKYLQAAGSMLSSTLYVFVAFSSMLTKAGTTACTVVLTIIFSSIPVHVNRNVTMALNKVNCSLWIKVPFLLSSQSFHLSTFCKMTSLRVSFFIEFSALELYSAC